MVRPRLVGSSPCAISRLATISTVYSVSLVLLLTALGVGLFHKRLRALEVLGIALALASLMLLVRFS